MIAGQDMSRLFIEWQPPVKQMVNPRLESEVNENSVRMGSCTQFEIIRSHGKDPIRFLKDRKRELDIMDAMGLVFTTDPRKISGAGQMQDGTGGKKAASSNSDENGDDGTENSEEK